MTSSLTTDTDVVVDPQATQRTYDLDRAHVFHSWSAQAALTPMVISAAYGSYVWDGEGKRYLDFSSQLVNTNIGHQHPRVVAGIKEQAERLCTIAPQHANDQRSEAARLITELAPDTLNRVFFTNAGAEAIEHAVRMARLHTGRPKVLTQYRSYHGGTQTAVNMTGDPRRWANDSGAAGVARFFGPFLYRSAFHATTEAEESARALEHLEQVVAFEGPGTIAALTLESVPGTAGIMPPPPGYLAGVRELCDRHGILYIADEVMAGFGRTGKWFAFEHFDVVPDLIAFAKGVNSGYVPLGGVIISDAVAATFADRVYPGGLTYSGHPLACAAAVATINAMREEGIVENAARIGEQVLGPGLRQLAERHPSIGEVRGLGVFWALELVKDRKTKEPLAPYGGTSPAMKAVLAACKERRLLPFVNFNRLHVVPPCTVSDAEIHEGLDILDGVLDRADEHCASARG
jgi:taurine--2-oxoglutarate transaminase